MLLSDAQSNKKRNEAWLIKNKSACRCRHAHAHKIWCMTHAPRWFTLFFFYSRPDLPTVSSWRDARGSISPGWFSQVLRFAHLTLTATPSDRSNRTHLGLPIPYTSRHIPFGMRQTSIARVSLACRVTGGCKDPQSGVCVVRRNLS